MFKRLARICSVVSAFAYPCLFTSSGRTWNNPFAIPMKLSRGTRDYKSQEKNDTSSPFTIGTDTLRAKQRCISAPTVRVLKGNYFEELSRFISCSSSSLSSLIPANSFLSLSGMFLLTSYSLTPIGLLIP